MSETITAGNRRPLQCKAVGASRFTETKQKQFLDTLAATCNVRMSAGAAGVALSSCYRLRARDSGFAAAWRQALTIGYDRLEEALLDYALSRVEGEEIDPETVDPAAIEGSVTIALADRSVSKTDLQLALSLLNRHRAAVDGRRAAGRGRRQVTAEETDAALTRKLDALARQLAGS